MRHICLYIGVQIFIAPYVRTGPPEVVQEALADLKMGDFQRIENDDHCTEGRRKIYSDFDYFDNDDLL